jgi:hypothetical protein
MNQRTQVFLREVLREVEEVIETGVESVVVPRDNSETSAQEIA